MAERALGDERSRAALLALHERGLNFEPPAADADLAAAGWHLDDYCQPLPSEPPGPPVEEGAWETARRLMLAYEFADPEIIEAVYEDDSPLEGRDMLLKARFWGLSFDLGVRARYDVDRNQFADPSCRRGARVGGGLHGPDVTADQDGHVPGANVFLGDEDDVGGLDHCIGCFDRADQAAGFDHPERF